MKKFTLKKLPDSLDSLLKPLAIAAVTILPFNTVQAQSATEVPTLQTITSELRSALSSAIPFETHEYQYTNTNSVDVFAGYLTVNRSTFTYSGPLPYTYYWPNDYYSQAGQTGPVENLYNACTYAGQLGYPEYRAIAQIVYGMTALRAVNVKGTIPYDDSRALKSYPVEYQSQEYVYNAILADLDEAIATLEEEQPDAATLQAIEGDELAQGTATAAYSGYDWRNWVKLANTIKLRLAMCLAKPNPDLAQQVATEALSGTGVLDDDFGPTWIKNNTQHPVYLISSSTGWADARMSASIENAMKRLGHPLIGYFFTTNTSAINYKTTGSVMLAAQKDYVGIRQGVTMEPKSNGEGYYNFSEVSPSVQYIRPTWVCKEEVLFLKAEAALRWGLGGSAQQNYEDGIRAVFNRYRASGVDDYLARTETVKDENGNEIDYVDYYIGENSCPGRIEIGVAWNDADSDETKLEKIITQKWIAMFPNGGYEAWTDFRRTGYPRLLPVPEENSWTGTPTFPVELQLRRIPYGDSYLAAAFTISETEVSLDASDAPYYITVTVGDGTAPTLTVESSSVISAELEQGANENEFKIKITPKGEGSSDLYVIYAGTTKTIYVNVISSLYFDNLSGQLRPARNTEQSIMLVVHETLSEEPLSTSLTLKEGTSLPVTTYSVSEYQDYYSRNHGYYIITFQTGNVKEDLQFRATVGNKTAVISVYVDYGLYLSYNIIDPADPGSNISSQKPLVIDTNSSAELRFNFYVEGEQEILQEIMDKIRDISNYKYEGTGNIMLGAPAVTPNANGSYGVSLPVYAGSKTGDGTITVNINGEKLTSSVYIDDGKRYDALYISFTQPNTYTMPPTELMYTTSKLVFSDESSFKIRVYHYISPDNRAEYIDWNVTQSGDPVCIEVGREVGSNYTDFEFMTSGVPGKAEITFNVYNPQGELGGEFAEYLNQTITATVTVADRESFKVNSVTFYPDNKETTASQVPLEAVMDPVVSSAVWPIEYSIVSLENGADATISLRKYYDGNMMYCLDINKAGTIKVKAEAGPEGNKKSDELVVTARLYLDAVNYKEPLQIKSAPEIMYVGETNTIEKLLHANYAVYEDRYRWTSSAPGVISVDGNGNITALSEGTAEITVSITDDYGNTATDSKTIEAVLLDLNLNVSALSDDYYVIIGSSGEFWIDMEIDGASGGEYYTFSLNTDILEADGTYTAGVDFTGTVAYPFGKEKIECVITGGTITVSGGVATFDLTVSYNDFAGKITGSKPILVL